LPAQDENLLAFFENLKFICHKNESRVRWPDSTNSLFACRLCPIWRNEKKVHNYQLMRIKYCADYSKWPNASKLMSTYGDNLNLYETLYAFQKP
uniref:Transposase n=1 Tax=Heligmosomoides polygyrus TaxID=6339 RepID=A0A183G3F6_HELPZ